MKLIDLSGQQFGRLTVLHRAPDVIQSNGRHRIMWECVCECGNTVICHGDNLRKGVSRSCGCYRKEYMSEHNSTHHASKDLLYGVWCAIKTRCNNKKSAAYPDYGGRGIRVCDDWNGSYEAFANWSYKSGYSYGLTIDRVNNDGDYCPENCRWVDRVAQANNRRNNVVLDYNGQSHTLKEWAGIVGICPATMNSRYCSGWPIERMLSSPLMANGKAFRKPSQ